MGVTARPSFAAAERRGARARSLGARRDSRAGRCRWKTAHRAARKTAWPRREETSAASKLRTHEESSKVPSRRVGTNLRGNKGGVLVGCAVTETAGSAFSSLGHSLPRRAKEGRSCRPHAGQPEGPTGSCPAASRSWPLPAAAHSARPRTRP